MSESCKSALVAAVARSRTFWLRKTLCGFQLLLNASDHDPESTFKIMLIKDWKTFLSTIAGEVGHIFDGIAFIFEFGPETSQKGRFAG